MSQSRREFLGRLSALSALPLLGSSARSLAATDRRAAFWFAYAAITWKGDAAAAIRDISSLGFRGVQLRSGVIKDYGDRPEVLKKMLADAGLALPMFSSGNVNIYADDEKAAIAEHVEHARFVKALGGKCIQLTSASRPKGREVSQEDLARCGRMMTEIGRQTAAIGVGVAFHNHMGQVGQKPEEVDMILQHADPRYVSFLLDIAHYQQGGGDPAAAVRKYRKRLHFMHIKDVHEVSGERGYQFVELGQGRVNLPAVFKALKEVRFSGCAIIELDAVPVQGRTPLESAQITKDYIEHTLHLSI